MFCWPKSKRLVENTGGGLPGVRGVSLSKRVSQAPSPSASSKARRMYKKPMDASIGRVDTMVAELGSMR